MTDHDHLKVGYGRVGHLWQGRYRSHLVETDGLSAAKGSEGGRGEKAVSPHPASLRSAPLSLGRGDFLEGERSLCLTLLSRSFPSPAGRGEGVLHERTYGGQAGCLPSTRELRPAGLRAVLETLCGFATVHRRAMSRENAEADQLGTELIADADGSDGGLLEVHRDLFDGVMASASHSGRGVVVRCIFPRRGDGAALGGCLRGRTHFSSG